MPLIRLTTEWPDLVKFHHFGNILKALVSFEMVYIVFGKTLKLLWLFLMLLGQFSLLCRAQCWTHNLVTLSVCLLRRVSIFRRHDATRSKPEKCHAMTFRLAHNLTQERPVFDDANKSIEKVAHVKKWTPSRPLFRLLSVFSNKENNFYNKSMWKRSCPSSIRRRDSNPQPFKHELSPITTKPWLPPKSGSCYKALLYVMYHTSSLLSLISMPIST